MASESVSDVMMRKLSTRYPTVEKNLTTLQVKFKQDNPTWDRSQTGTKRSFYAASSTESEATAALRFWGNLVP